MKSVLSDFSLEFTLIFLTVFGGVYDGLDLLNLLDGLDGIYDFLYINGLYGLDILDANNDDDDNNGNKDLVGVY